MLVFRAKAKNQQIDALKEWRKQRESSNYDSAGMENFPMEDKAGSGSTSTRLPSPKQQSSTRYRWQWYQTNKAVSLEVFIKGMKDRKDHVKVNIGEDFFQLMVDKEGDGVPYVLDLHLFGKVVPKDSTYEILSSKIEFKLVKADGTNWLDFEDPSHKIEDTGNADPSAPVTKKTPQDWQKLDAELEEMDKNENVEGEAALQKLFKDIYSKADEDTQRAMMKSFQESNGTVLSTNWKEVGAKKVDIQPPQGMEAKKYEH